MRTILDAAAAYERALIRARTKAALRAKRDRGQRAGAVPFGFTADAAGVLSPNATEQAVIAHVRELRAAGLPLRAIVRECSGAGLVSRAGTPITLTQVARMLAPAASVA
jgi:DNA invertase Pin-like site-specific DNA recombinase